MFWNLDIDDISGVSSESMWNKHTDFLSMPSLFSLDVLYIRILDRTTYKRFFNQPL